MAVKKGQGKPVQFPADLSPKFQTQPLRKTRHHETLKSIEDPCRRVDPEQDHDLPAAMLPGHAKCCSRLYRRADLPPEKIYDPGAVDRRRHGENSVKHNRDRHDHKAETLSSHGPPKPPDGCHGVGRHGKFHLVLENILFIFLILSQLPRLLSSVILRSPGIPGSFPSVPHACQCRRSCPRPGR